MYRGVSLVLALTTGFTCKNSTDRFPIVANLPAQLQKPATHVTVKLHGSVHDYREQPVADAVVTGMVDGQSRSVRTDGTGHFELNVDPGTYITASKADMYGSVTVGPERDQTVVIKMAQMPK
jgi:hypothetical protein